MPYIKQDNRDVLDPAIDELKRLLVNLHLDDESDNMEENINYIFTKLLKRCYSSNNYSEVNDALGIISAVQHEFYRRVAVPLENQSQHDNGDIGH